jgi:hypothetical protein
MELRAVVLAHAPFRNDALRMDLVLVKRLREIVKIVARW